MKVHIDAKLKFRSFDFANTKLGQHSTLGDIKPSKALSKARHMLRRRAALKKAAKTQYRDKNTASHCIH